MLALARQAELRKINSSPPNWAVAFGREAPLEVDLGCGRGDYAWNRARQVPQINLVALDMRKKFIEQLRQQQKLQKLQNFRAIRCDISQDLPILFSTSSVSIFTVHHPDPWWKKRHRKRRLVKPETLCEWARLLVSQGLIFLQTDVPDLASEIASVFRESSLFSETNAEQIWEKRLGGIPSHREKKCRQKGIPIQRLAFVRNQKKEFGS